MNSILITAAKVLAYFFGGAFALVIGGCVGVFAVCMFMWAVWGG